MNESYKCPECEAYHLGGASAEVVRQRKVKEAAPLMLKALKKIVDLLYSSKSNNPQEIADIAQAAIDAAEGEEVK